MRTVGRRMERWFYESSVMRLLDLEILITTLMSNLSVLPPLLTIEFGSGISVEVPPTINSILRSIG